MTSRLSGLIVLTIGAAFLWTAHHGMAQDAAAQAVTPVPMGIATPATGAATPPADTAAIAPPADPNVPPSSTVEGEINPNDIPSLLFTFWEHTAIVDAKRWVGRVRTPTDSELMGDLKPRDGAGVKPPPEERDINLGGIVYVTGDDWTIWLNGKRVTPTAIPKEAMDLKVHEEYIEMKWFDDYTNQIFPLRLRPHQRFNIDTRIFLPG